MRSWKICNLRDVLFDGSTIWLVVGQGQTTKLIKFDADKDAAINIKRPDLMLRYGYRSTVTPLGPVSARTAFLLPNTITWDMLGKRKDQEYLRIRKVEPRNKEKLWGKLKRNRDSKPESIKIAGRTAPVQLRGYHTKTITTNGDALLVGRCGVYEIGDNEHSWRLTLFRGGGACDYPVVFAKPYQYGLYMPFATANGVSVGNYFIGIDGRQHSTAQNRRICDVSGDRRLEFDGDYGRIGSLYLYLDEQCYAFTKTVHGARFSPDGMTAFVWGARELVQFDIT